MKWNFDFNLRVISGAALAMVALACLGDAKEVNVRVDGMVCYSCAFGIQKMCKVEKIGKGYEKDIEKGLFKINLGPQENIPEPKKLEEIVHNAGYTYRGAQIEVKGALMPQSNDKRLAIRVAENDQLIWAEVTPEMRVSLTNEKDRVFVMEADEKAQGWTVVSVKNTLTAEQKVE